MSTFFIILAAIICLGGKPTRYRGRGGSKKKKPHYKPNGTYGPYQY